MLDHVLAVADEAGIRETWGSVPQVYIDATPHLLKWYGDHGFAISEPDADCIDTAAKKVARKLPRDTQGDEMDEQ